MAAIWKWVWGNNIVFPSGLLQGSHSFISTETIGNCQEQPYSQNVGGCQGQSTFIMVTLFSRCFSGRDIEFQHSYLLCAMRITYWAELANRLNLSFPPDWCSWWPYLARVWRILHASFFVYKSSKEVTIPLALVRLTFSLLICSLHTEKNQGGSCFNIWMIQDTRAPSFRQQFSFLCSLA